MHRFTTLTLILCSLSLAGCGGSSNKEVATGQGASLEGDAPTVLTGQLIDSPVAGVSFITATESGITNAQGEFQYQEGQTVEFRIGDIQFPITQAQSIVTLLDLANTANVNHPQVIDMARLLQSLDQDCDPSNGITIGQEAHQNAAGLTVDFGSTNFISQVTNLVANGGQQAECQSLVSIPIAVAHVRASLVQLERVIGSTLDFINDEVSNAAARVQLQPLVGQWSGSAGDASRFYWDVDLDIGNNQFTVSYPTLGLTGCTGTLTPVSVTETGVLLSRTTFEQDLDTGCLSGGIVELRPLSDGQMHYIFYPGTVEAARSEFAGFGTLSRQ